ncbi:integral membrane protein [Seiridium cupressi]
MSAPVQIRTFPLPSRGRCVSLSIAAIVMLLSSRKEVIAPGSPIYDYLLEGRPNALANAIRAQNGIFYILFGIHSVETVLFAATKLRKHGVPFLSPLWWKWALLPFISGSFAWQHFDKAVKATAAKQSR